MRFVKVLRQFRHSKVRLSVGICAVLATLLVATKFYAFTMFMQRNSMARRSRPPNNQTCVLPDLAIDGAPSPVETSFRQILHPLPPISCANEQDWVEVIASSGSGEQSQVRIRESLLREHPKTSCNYTFMRRWSDHNNRILDTVSASGSQSIPLMSDFFHVACWHYSGSGVSVSRSAPNGSGTELSENGTTEIRPMRIWRNVMTGVMRKEKIGKADSTSGSSINAGRSDRMNVVMWGFDSMSRVSFTTKLPKSYRYLTEALGGVVLRGYNIVGDGTPQALIPILTGKTERELPETRKRMLEQAHFVDVYPFVWNDFSAAGYVTAFLEDTPQVGTFTYRLKGFDEQPTDHYMRPFYLEVQKVKSEHERLCLGSVPRHKVMMKYVEDFFDTYHDVPKYAFAFHGELSHDDADLIVVADDDLMHMLQSLNDKGHFNNTVLILFSDHGPRFSETRETQRGKQEERLPFFSIVLPKHLRSLSNVEYRHLLANANRLTTPFDVHRTLMHVLQSSDPSGERRQQINASRLHKDFSLLTEVPLSRSCSEAGIEAHWCACLEFDDVALDHEHVIQAAQTLVNHINSLTQPQRALCHTLTLKSIVSAQRYVPQTDLLRFKNSADLDGFLGDFSAKTNISDVIYQVSIVTDPGGGHFEASVPYCHLTKTMTMSSDTISRTNAYGQSAHCVSIAQPDLRKYCNCKIIN